MLNLNAFRLLAGPLIPDETAKFFFGLMRDYDLRTYRVIPLDRLREVFGCDLKTLTKHFECLSRTGLLEIGPSASIFTKPRKRSMSPTWRLGRPFLLSARDLSEWESDSRAEEERMSIAPPVEPNELIDSQ